MKSTSDMKLLTTPIEGSESGIYQSSEKCFYVVLPTGERKFINKNRLDKLANTHNGDLNAVLSSYRTRTPKKV